jgi:hypothetical protein
MAVYDLMAFECREKNFSVHSFDRLMYHELTAGFTFPWT